jgi:hypothetical protein
MVINLNKAELKTCKAAVNSIIKVGELRLSEFKPHSLDMRLLEENRAILDKLKYADDLINKPDHIGELISLTLNRVQAKVMTASIQTVHGLQQRVRAGYEERPENDAAFEDSPGRRKTDYVAAVAARMSELEAILEKVRRAL